MGLFDKIRQSLSQGLQKTKELLRTDVRDLFKPGEILDEGKLREFEKNLIRSDMGVTASQALVQELREKHLGRTVILDEIRRTMQDKLASLLIGEGEVRFDPADPLAPLAKAPAGPTVILVSGVNGVGKTTSIAKLARLIQQQHKKVVLAAGDTFRAAAVEQLAMWSQRLGCDIVTKPAASDPAAVAYAGCERAVETNADYLVVDTAGRLQTQKNLMDQLGKIPRVMAKVIPDAPHERLLVLDATTGQNGLSQAKHFSEAVSCTGIVLAKLDGTAKGGIVVAIRQQMGLPVKYVGVGEKIDDLAPFDARSFVEALFAE
jgi:fused signal recognition particle receptor